MYGVIGGLLFLLLVVSFFGLRLYQDIMADKVEGFDTVTSSVLDETKINAIDQISRYHGEQLYYVVQGKSQDTSYYVFVSETEDTFDYTMFEKAPLYSKQEIINDWQNRCDQCELLDSDIGFANGYPIVEVTYKNNQDLLVYEHVLLDDMSHYKLTLKPNIE